MTEPPWLPVAPKTVMSLDMVALVLVVVLEVVVLFSRCSVEMCDVVNGMQAVDRMGTVEENHDINTRW